MVRLLDLWPWQVVGSSTACLCHIDIVIFSDVHLAAISFPARFFNLARFHRFLHSTKNLTSRMYE